jgi:hypothetical protein
MTERQTTGRLIRVSAVTDDQGRSVVRHIVDFYDGSAPPISFRTIFEGKPVTIIEVDDTDGERSEKT